MNCIACARETFQAVDGLCRGCRLRKYTALATKYPFTPQMDDELRRIYRRTARRPELSDAITHLCKLWRIPRDIVLKRAQILGVCLIPKPAWTPQQIAYLREYAGTRPIHRMAKDLGRSYSSVNQKLQDIGLTGAVTDGYSYAELAALMGVVGSKIARWVDKGWLALRDGRVTYDSVRRFVWEHMEDFRFAACDEWWLKTMLRPQLGTGCAAKFHTSSIAKATRREAA